MVKECVDELKRVSLFSSLINKLNDFFFNPRIHTCTSTAFCTSYTIFHTPYPIDNTKPISTPTSTPITHPTNQTRKNSKMHLTSLLLTILPLSFTTVYALPNPDGSNTACVEACAESDAELQCEEPYVWLVSSHSASIYEYYDCGCMLTRVVPEILSASRVSYVLYLGCVSRDVLVAWLSENRVILELRWNG